MNYNSFLKKIALTITMPLIGVSCVSFISFLFFNENIIKESDTFLFIFIFYMAMVGTQMSEVDGDNINSRNFLSIALKLLVFRNKKLY